MSVIAEQRSRTRAAKQLGYLPLSFAVLIMVLPLAWMIISSLKRPGELLSVPVVWLPADPTMANYERAMDMVPVGRFFLNSTMVTVIGAGLKVALALTTAYALVFIRIPGRKVVFTMVLVALMVPLHITLVPNYTLIAQMGGRNTLWGIILPGLGTAFATFLLRQQFLTLPHSVVEAAQIDGAGYLRRLTHIVAPMSLPVLATVTLLTVVNEWNEYLWPLIIVDDPNMMTLPVGLTLLQNSESGSASWGVLMAGTAMVIIPVLIIFVLMQRWIVSGLTQGAVTG